MFLPLAAAGGKESSAFSRFPQQHFLFCFVRQAIVKRKISHKAFSCAKFIKEVIYRKKNKKSTGNSLPC